MFWGMPSSQLLFLVGRSVMVYGFWACFIIVAGGYGQKGLPRVEMVKYIFVGLW